MWSKAGVLLQIAWRNLFSSVLNVIIGLIIAGGTFLVVIGGSALDSLEQSMRGSIVGAVSGDVQVWSADSKDELSLFGNGMGGESDISPMMNFPKVEQAFEKVPNVQAVVPMGFINAMVTSGNTVDLMLAKLRAEVMKQQRGDTSAETKAKVDSLKAHVHHIVEVLQKDRENTKTIAAEGTFEQRDEEAIQKASTEEFWAAFDQDPLGSLEYLENRIAPLLSEGELLGLRLMGTDLSKFQKAFDRMELVDGTYVPDGQKGMLIPKFAYDETFKLKTARRLDRIKEEMEENHKTILGDPDLTRMVHENTQQTREIILQLDPLKTKEAVARLQKALGSKDAELEPLLVQLLDTTDANFMERYALFYKELAPLLELYRVRMGDQITLKSFTGSGYLESVNVKVYGTFRFRGLEKSPLAGVTSLVDMISFRDLYGFMTPERKAEIAKLKAQSGAKDVSRENAEAELFGEDTSGVVTEGQSTAIDEAVAMGPREDARDQKPETFTQADIDNGLVLNAAVMLKDKRELGRTLSALKDVAQKENLNVKVLEGPRATGLIGQLVQYIRYALYLVAGIIFLVALVILSNAVLMATLQRVREIGTVRAIGAQRGFVRWMITIETLVLGTVFGLAGIVAGSGLVALIGKRGIPANNQQLYFFFGGPRWFPSVSPTYVAVGYLIVLVVTLGATLYPALIATRVPPVQAMQSED